MLLWFTACHWEFSTKFEIEVQTTDAFFVVPRGFSRARNAVRVFHIVVMHDDDDVRLSRVAAGVVRRKSCSNAHLWPSPSSANVI